jgi:general stress protein 26
MSSSFDHRLLIEPAERQIDQFARFAEQVLPEGMEIARSNASQIKLATPPTALLDETFDDKSAHTLITMAHIARQGHPFQSVLGFHYMDSKIHVMSRGNAAKVKLLESNPLCSFIYHNNVPNPSKMACITLVGKAKVIHDRDYVERANAAMIRKSFRDSEISPGGVERATKTMNEADRRAIVLDEIDGIYINYPAPSYLPSGLPLPVISWRRDRA